jgi:hypothetical protein
MARPSGTPTTNATSAISAALPPNNDPARLCRPVRVNLFETDCSLIQ